MQFRIVDWNTGGCRIRTTSADPLDFNAYTHTDVDYVIDVLKGLEPDIVTFQELHSNKVVNQAATIAKGLGFHWYVSDAFSESHMEKGQLLTQAIIARYPLTRHVRTQFTNPNFQVVWKDGKTIVSTHDRGVTSCILHINDEPIVLKTFHLIPFDPFKVDPFSEKAHTVFQDVSNKLRDDAKRMVLTGDLNLGSRIPPVKDLLPELINRHTHELDQPLPTIPYHGERPDRIVYRGLKAMRSSVSDLVLTDHYPVVADFKLIQLKQLQQS